MTINQIYNQPNMETMLKMPDSFIDGILTSPPYNLTSKRKDVYYNNGYSNLDGLTEEQYLQNRIEEFIQFQRILKDEGVILYNISYHNENPILPLLLITEVHKQTNLTVADMISWKKNHSIPFQTSPNKLSRIVEQVYVIVKKDKLHSFRTNKEVSKINQKTGQKFYKGYNNLIEAKNNDGIICELKASYSTELVSKLINIYFPKPSVIYDPFSGIATTAVACKNNGLDYIGSEINEKFWKIGNDRLK
jgi:site-specific DNA-methyltransferase (adenine-specific)